MEAKAIALFTRFAYIERLYRTHDGEYFIELVECEAYLLHNGGGGYTIIERSSPLPEIPSPVLPGNPIWVLVNDPIGGLDRTYSGIISFTNDTLGSTGNKVHTTNAIGAFAVGNYVLAVARNGNAKGHEKYGQITAIDENELTINWLSYKGGSKNNSATEWDILLTGKTGNLANIAGVNLTLLPPGGAASASVSGTPEDRILNFSLPAGPKGDNGGSTPYFIGSIGSTLYFMINYSLNEGGVNNGYRVEIKIEGANWDNSKLIDLTIRGISEDGSVQAKYWTIINKGDVRASGELRKFEGMAVFQLEFYEGVTGTYPSSGFNVSLFSNRDDYDIAGEPLEIISTDYNKGTKQFDIPVRWKYQGAYVSKNVTDNTWFETDIKMDSNIASVVRARLLVFGDEMINGPEGSSGNSWMWEGDLYFVCVGNTINVAKAHNRGEVKGSPQLCKKGGVLQLKLNAVAGYSYSAMVEINEIEPGQQLNRIMRHSVGTGTSGESNKVTPSWVQLV